MKLYPPRNPTQRPESAGGNYPGGDGWKAQSSEYQPAKKDPGEAQLDMAIEQARKAEADAAAKSPPPKQAIPTPDEPAAPGVPEAPKVERMNRADELSRSKDDQPAKAPDKAVGGVGKYYIPGSSGDPTKAQKTPDEPRRPLSDVATPATPEARRPMQPGWTRAQPSSDNGIELYNMPAAPRANGLDIYNMTPELRAAVEAHPSGGEAIPSRPADRAVSGIVRTPAVGGVGKYYVPGSSGAPTKPARVAGSAAIGVADQGATATAPWLGARADASAGRAASVPPTAISPKTEWDRPEHQDVSETGFGWGNPQSDPLNQGYTQQNIELGGKAATPATPGASMWDSLIGALMNRKAAEQPRAAQ
jgi:hypothetical protein